MGCGSSNANFEPPRQARIFENGDNADPSAKKPSNFGKRTDLNPEDFIYKERSGVTLIKEPGQIDNQQFIIEDCNSSDIFLLDLIGSLTVDNCRGCRIL